jgi:hypothetical protein
MQLFLDESMAPLVDSDDGSDMGEYSLENSKVMERQAPKQEDSAARAKRLAEQLRFRLKESMAQRGGSEAFLHWLRSEGEKSA